MRGDIPRERWGHSSFMWGRQLVLGMGSDEGHETNAVNMLNMDTLTWESWDGNQQRVGGAMGLLEGKLFLVGGQAIYICMCMCMCVCVCVCSDAFAHAHAHVHVTCACHLHI